MIEPLGKEDAQALLRSHRYGRLGCCFNGEPYVVPINYVYDGETVYIHSLMGLKIQMMRENPMICLQVDEVKDEYNWQSVIAFGKYEEITDAQEHERRLAAIFQKMPHLTPVESQMITGEEEAIVFCLRIHRITGVSEHWR